MQTVTEIFDVVICGAGPAGSTCALALGESGLKVSLLDKSSFPRDKICGDIVVAYVPKVLHTIHPKYADALKKFSEKEMVDSVRIVAPNEKILDLKFPEEGFISTRLKFDNFLFDLAAQLPNVKMFLNTTVKDVTVHDSGVSIHTENITIEAKLVIGCDGAQSVVNRKLTDTKIDLKHHSGAVRAYFKNVKDIPASTFELHFLKNSLPGYFWIFPLPDNFSNVGFGLISQTISDKKVNLRDEMLRIIEQTPYLKERFRNSEMVSDIKGFGLPLGSRRVTISGKRFMLCGDAASLIDPLTGEGIGQAMVSGRYAGWHALKCFETNDFSVSFMKGYNKMVYDKLWKEHYMRYMVQRLISKKPWVINAAVNLAGKSAIFNAAMKKLIW